jgi:cardiolipin synthase
MLQNLPNILTVSRILLLPVLIGLLLVPHDWAVWTAVWIYAFCAITDFFDGYLARRFETTSKFGTFLDPISDKIMVGCLLLVLAGIGRLPELWMVPALIIMTREFLISGLREFLGPQNISVPVSKLAKWKTTVQMVALGFLVAGNLGNSIVPHTLLIGQVGLTIAAVITVITGWSYLKVGFKYIN